MASGTFPRTVVHVDMDAFFASVETLLHPEYRGKPLVVGADPKIGRGVVSTCNYEARKYGIHSAMPIREAYRRCPHAIFVRPDFASYERYSRMVRVVLDRFSPRVEPLSIDEAFLDMTGCEHFYPSLRAMGLAIKEAIREATGLTASVGVAPNKFLAKLASDFDKPDGLVVVEPGQVQAFLDPLPVEKVWGVGQKGASRLRAHGIATVADLRRRSLAWLRREFGPAFGEHLYQLARGIDHRSVEPYSEPQSMSREITFDVDVEDPSRLRSVLASLVADVGRPPSARRPLGPHGDAQGALPRLHHHHPAPHGGQGLSGRRPHLRAGLGPPGLCRHPPSRAAPGRGRQRLRRNPTDLSL